MAQVTDYWHAVMRDTVLQIVNEVGFDGCYVDQVGNGEVCAPVCWCAISLSA